MANDLGRAFGDDDDQTLTGDKRILHRARQRFKRTQKYWETTFTRAREDTKFANADDRNHWQWPDAIYADRNGRRKPCLTINKTETHNNLIVNESMLNKSSPRVRPTGNGATLEAALAYQSIIERIENISTATTIYRRAIKQQVDGGISWIGLYTTHTGKTFDQDIYLKGFDDVECVMLDPDHKEPDGTDAMFGFVFEKVQRDVFNRRYPKYKNKIGQSTLDADMLWMDDKHVLVCDYHEREGTNDELIEYTTADGSKFTGFRSEMAEAATPELVDEIIDQIERGMIEGRYRDCINYAVNWYLIGGDCIMKRGDKPSTRWAGSYIPIIPLYGRRTLIEGILDCKGHTRTLIGPQQMLNYNASAQVQYVALQTRTQWIGPKKAFEANEQAWATANIDDRAFLPFDDYVEEEGGQGRELKPPQRIDPPQASPAYSEGAVAAERWMMMASGQYEQQFGVQNQQAASSGKAINARQRQGDQATYHFTEGQYDLYRAIGKHIIDLVPKIYDTQRILNIEDAEGNIKQIIHIDPSQEAAVRTKRKAEEDAAEEIVFNPNVGEYAVISDPGPNYATQRQQAWDALSMIVQQNMELVGVIGDILFANADFPGAPELVERLRREIKQTKPYLFEEGIPPALAALQMEFQKQQGLNIELTQKLAEMRLELKGKQHLRDVEAFNADTKRMEAEIKALKELLLSPTQREEFERELSMRSHEAALEMIKAEHAAEIAPEPAAATE